MMPASCAVPKRLPRSASKRFLQRSRVADTAFDALSGSSSMASRTSSANSPNWWCSFGSMHRRITKGRCTPSTASSSVCRDNDLLCQSERTALCCSHRDEHCGPTAGIHGTKYLAVRRRYARFPGMEASSSRDILCQEIKDRSRRLSHAFTSSSSTAFASSNLSAASSSSSRASRYSASTLAAT